MQLGAERKARIQHRLAPMLAKYDPELQFITVFVDSMREDLGIVAQLGERPLLLKFRWVDFISSDDETLRRELYSRLDKKLDRQPAQPRAL
jgi:hypothetical protein